MIERYEKSVKALSAASLVGWALFLLISAEDIKPALNAFIPKGLQSLNEVVFWVFIAAFFVAGFLCFADQKGFKISGISMRLILGGVFMMAAVPKILDPAGFALDMSHYDFFPKATVNFLAIVVPWVELFIALSIIFRVGEAGGVLLVNLLMVSFLVLLGQAWYRGLDIDCGCFGHSGARASVAKAFIRDLFFIAWGILLYLFSKKRPATRAI